MNVTPGRYHPSNLESVRHRVEAESGHEALQKALSKVNIEEAGISVESPIIHDDYVVTIEYIPHK